MREVSRDLLRNTVQLGSRCLCGSRVADWDGLPSPDGCSKPGGGGVSQDIRFRDLRPEIAELLDRGIRSLRAVVQQMRPTEIKCRSVTPPTRNE